MPITLFIKRYRWGLLIIAVLLLLTFSFLSFGDDTARFRHSLDNSSNEQLLERGRRYYRENKMDSALLIFSYLGDKYDSRLPDSEKRTTLLARNNAGIIYAFQYMDYPRGYAALSEAFELADAPGFEAPQTVICHNIIELLRLHKLCFRSNNVDERISDYLEVGIQKALKGREYSALTSMSIFAIQYDLYTNLNHLRAIMRSEVPDSVDGVTYARHLYRAASLLQSDSASRARTILNEARPLLPTSYSPAYQYVVGHILAVAQTYAGEKNYAMAEREALRALAMADSTKSRDNQLLMLAFLSNLPVEQKERYAHRLLQVKDSAISQGQLQMVSEIDFLRSLNREREEKARLAQERTRLFWGLITGGVLLAVFGALIWMLVRSRRTLRERNASLYAKIQEQLAASEAPRVPQRKPAQSDVSKYAGSSLSPEKMDELQSRLTALMSNEQWVCDSDISLARTASELGVNTTYLSRVVNERFGMSFSALLNEYRVPIATRRMNPGSEYANQTIESIGRSVGYLSRSSFIAAFKKINGMTPSEYIKCQAMDANRQDRGEA